MARKGQAKIKITPPDFVHQSPVVTKLINSAMKDGKKSAAEKQVYNALQIAKKEIGGQEDPLAIFDIALSNIRPKVEVRPRRIGGAVYQVPTAVRYHRQNALALRWLITSSRLKPSKQFHTFAEKLASEIVSAYKNEGSAVAKRMEVEKMAEANKAFAHLRW